MRNLPEQTEKSSPPAESCATLDLEMWPGKISCSASCSGVIPSAMLDLLALG